MQRFNLKKITLTAIFSAFALISFMIEQLLPPLFLPGAKIGFANVFILLALVLIGNKSAFIVLLLKCVLGSVFSGNVSAIMYSLPSSILALITEIALFRGVKSFSVISISVVGAVITSAVQNVIFCLITGTIANLTYLPYLVLIAILAGVIVVFTLYTIIKIIPNRVLDKIT